MSLLYELASVMSQRIFTATDSYRVSRPAFPDLPVKQGRFVVWKSQTVLFKTNLFDLTFV